MNLLDTLLVIKERAIKGDMQIRKYGICYNIALVSRSGAIDHSSQEIRQFKELYTKWPEYTGNRDYPVPSYGSWLHPMSAFNYSYDMYEGEYGAARMRLLNWCIEELQK